MVATDRRRGGQYVGWSASARAAQCLGTGFRTGIQSAGVVDTGRRDLPCRPRSPCEGAQWHKQVRPWLSTRTHLHRRAEAVWLRSQNLSSGKIRRAVGPMIRAVAKSCPEACKVNRWVLLAGFYENRHSGALVSAYEDRMMNISARRCRALNAFSTSLATVRRSHRRNWHAKLRAAPLRFVHGRRGRRPDRHSGGRADCPKRLTCPDRGGRILGTGLSASIRPGS